MQPDLAFIKPFYVRPRGTSVSQIVTACALLPTILSLARSFIETTADQLMLLYETHGGQCLKSELVLVGNSVSFTLRFRYTDAFGGYSAIHYTVTAVEVYSEY